MGSSASAVSSYGFPEIVPGTPITSPASAIHRIRTFQSAELADIFTRPLYSTNTPRGSCPSTNSTAPFGYVAEDETESSPCRAFALKSQNSRSECTGQVTHDSNRVNP